MIPHQQQRERSLSPDSLEQRLLKQQMFVEDDDESFLSSSSSSLIDSINIDSQQHHSNSTKTILKTLTAHGLLNTLTFSNENND